MKITDIETSRFLLRGFIKEDAEYLKQLEVLGEDEECCYLILVVKDSFERVGTCSFIMQVFFLGNGGHIDMSR